MNNKPEYWFNTVTKQVELGEQSPLSDRLGPFDSPEAAAHANEKLEANARKWAEEDAREAEEDEY